MGIAWLKTVVALIIVLFGYFQLMIMCKYSSYWPRESRPVF